MKTILNHTMAKLEVKHSIFISYLYRVNTIDEINLLLHKTKKEHDKATHCCYSYILDNLKKASDDKEPSKTAGMPILNILEKNELDHVLCIVIRYFGGIKLGASGLVRAYSESAKLAVNNATFINYVLGYHIIISCDYKQLATLSWLKPYVININYLDKIEIEAKISEEIYQKLILLKFAITKLEECLVINRGT